MNDTSGATQARELLIIDAVETTEPTIGRWLGAIEDSRARTRRWLDGIDPRAIDWERGDENTIGTLLYHIAAIEADWLYAEVLEQPFPPDVIELFPFNVRDEGGRLTPVFGRSLDQHLSLLDAVRARLLATFRTMTIEDFHRPRPLPAYDVTPEWVLHHLMQHEAEHRGQIGLMRTAAEQSWE